MKSVCEFTDEFGLSELALAISRRTAELMKEIGRVMSRRRRRTICRGRALCRSGHRVKDSNKEVTANHESRDADVQKAPGSIREHSAGGLKSSKLQRSHMLERPREARPAKVLK